MNWNHLEKFLELINMYNIDFKKCPNKVLYNNFKNNEYYILKNFCEINNLIIKEYKYIELTQKGKEVFTNLKKWRLIYK
jgi:hypothetical protein